MENIPKGKQPQETGEIMSLQVLAGNGFVNLIFNPYSETEICFTINAQQYQVLTERLSGLSHEAGHDLMSFRLYENEIPFDDEE